MDDREIVSAIRARLVERLGKDRYEVWFGSGTGLAVGGDKLVITVRTQFFKDWLRRHFRKDIEATVEAAVGRPLTLELRIAAVPVEVVTAVERNQRPAPPAVLPPTPTVPKRSTALRDGDFHCLESFVVGNSNCLAHKAAQMAAEQAGHLFPLARARPHAAPARRICSKAFGPRFAKHQPRAATVLSFGRAVHQPVSRSPARQRLAQLPPQVSRRRTADRSTTCNSSPASGPRWSSCCTRSTTLLRAAGNWCSPPIVARSLKVLGPELMTRLSGGMVCRIEPPDYATRLGIVRQMAARMRSQRARRRRERSSPRTSPRQARELAGALNRLHATSHGARSSRSRWRWPRRPWPK